MQIAGTPIATATDSRNLRRCMIIFALSNVAVPFALRVNLSGLASALSASQPWEERKCVISPDGLKIGGREVKLCHALCCLPQRNKWIVASEQNLRDRNELCKGCYGGSVGCTSN